MRIFITGASGFIGSAFIAKLKETLKHHDTVFVLSRQACEFNDKRFHTLIGTLESIEQYTKIILSCTYVFHIAANATFGNTADYDSVNYIPTKKIVDILKGSKRLKNFIFISTIGAIDRHKHDQCTAPLTTQSVPSPRSKYGLSKLKAEQYITATHIPYTIIRPTWVYGKHMRQESHINLFVTLAYKKNPLMRCNFPGKVSLIHVDDLVTSFAHCIGNDHIIGKTYFAETENRSFGELFSLIAKQVHPSKDAFTQIPVPSFKLFIARVHSLLPVPIANLFINYLYVTDPAYHADLLSGIPLKRIDATIPDVISTNTAVSGYWVITGANSGIGLALARKLHMQNKNLILIDKEASVLKEEFTHSNIIHPNINHSNTNHTKIIIADLSSHAEISRAVQEIQHYLIYCLVNNAGIGYRKSFAELSAEEISRIIAVNINAQVFITKLLLDKLKKDRSVIVNIASSAAYNPLPNMLLYSSTKAFISNWSESLTFELRDTNHVITFSPSGTNTNFQQTAGVRKENNGKGLKTPEYVADKIIDAVKKNRSVVILDFKTNILLYGSKFLPRKLNILFWGNLFKKMR
ncbi:MAG: SDR family NAD(P)-dependent oxidoreductase [Candidatus Woesearchaeota archaeon]